MPYTLHWYIPNEIIYARYTGVVTSKELRDCLLDMHDLINNSPRALVHAISDVGEITVNVPLKESMKVVREVGDHPRSGWMITIREKSSVLKMGSAIAASLFRLRFRAFDTIDQAVVHLKNYDKNLSWDKVNTSLFEVSSAK